MAHLTINIQATFIIWTNGNRHTLLIKSIWTLCSDILPIRTIEFITFLRTNETPQPIMYTNKAALAFTALLMSALSFA